MWKVSRHPVVTREVFGLRFSRQITTSVFDHRINKLSANLEHLILNREWTLKDPSAEITNIELPDDGGHSFKILRDDIGGNPFISGNKRRKLDALIPQLIADGFTDVITCGGSQSAHILAVAAAAADNGLRSHLLVRGEKPEVVSGNHLYARMLAHRFVYVTRSKYADRAQMLANYADSLSNILNDGTSKIAIIQEGGFESAALLGLIRLVDWLETAIEADKPWKLVIDSGTGTSAVGLALGAVLLDLPWKIIGIMLAGPQEYYKEQTIELVRSFCAKEGIPDAAAVAGAVAEKLNWVPRLHPRKFGNVLPGEIEECKKIATAYGVVLDPIWTLPAWERSVHEVKKEGKNNSNVLMLHTGGTLGLCGLAQRYPDQF